MREWLTQTPVLLLLALGLVVVTQARLAWWFGALPGSQRSAWTVAVPLILLLAVPAAFLLYAMWRARNTILPAGFVVAIAVAGVLMRLPYFGAGPMLEDDHFRYVLDGAMLAHGLDPYAYAPSSLIDGTAPDVYRRAAAAGRKAIEQVNFPELRSIYPGTAQALFGLAHLIKPWSVDGLRALLMACEALTAVLAFCLLRKTGVPAQFVALIWCNPLLAFSLTGQAHVDAALAALVLASLIAAAGRSGIIAGVALGLAAGVKLWPALLAPLILRKFGNDRRRMTGFAVAIAASSLAVLAPLMLSAATPDSGLVAYARGWQINNLPYAWISYAGYLLAGGTGLEPFLRLAVAAASVALALALAVRPVVDTADLVRRAMLVAAATFYLSPSQFPWYASWFLPMAAIGRNWALLAASSSLAAYFLFFPLAGPIWGDLFGFWLSGLHLAPVVVISLMNRAHKR